MADMMLTAGAISGVQHDRMSIRLKGAQAEPQGLVPSKDDGGEEGQVSEGHSWPVVEMMQPTSSGATPDMVGSTARDKDPAAGQEFSDPLGPLGQADIVRVFARLKVNLQDRDDESREANHADTRTGFTGASSHRPVGYDRGGDPSSSGKFESATDGVYMASSHTYGHCSRHSCGKGINQDTCTVDVSLLLPDLAAFQSGRIHARTVNGSSIVKEDSCCPGQVQLQQQQWNNVEEALPLVILISGFQASSVTPTSKCERDHTFR